MAATTSFQLTGIASRLTNESRQAKDRLSTLKSSFCGQASSVSAVAKTNGKADKALSLKITCTATAPSVSSTEVVDTDSVVYNFAAGPATLPKNVLKKAQEDLLDWNGWCV